uniref:Fibronectin type-II domain-containing protein n=1 Tax=Denticeps clupeoides TaxID=299321 RepID=A0AAY4A822_9TELE
MFCTGLKQLPLLWSESLKTTNGGKPTIHGNANGAPCLFPFHYKGNLYTSCTYADHNALWCATTANYDRDKLWGDCGNANGARCVFPFQYKKNLYTSCTDINHKALWCATTANYDQDELWGHCSNYGKHTIHGNANGAPCLFPFQYKENLYTSCTYADHNALWCATTANYDRDKLWGDCKPTTGGNANGAPCLFPFQYKENLYTSCTYSGHDTLWCATTANYDRDKLWGDCTI